MIADRDIGFIGAGNMGGALIRGVIDGGVVRAGKITVTDVVPEALAALGELGLKTTAEASAAAGRDIVVLAVKPQVASEVIASVSASIRGDATVVSIMAGVTTASIEERLPLDIAVVRAMPQLLAFTGMSATAICAGAHAGASDLALATELFDQVGSTVTVDESQMNAVTGLSGSGPAYVYTIIEALIDGGVAVGLTRAVATQLAAQTVLGAAQSVMQTGESPASLRSKVTSPGGTTIAALQVLEERGLRGALIDAVRAATERARELGGQK